MRWRPRYKAETEQFGFSDAGLALLGPRGAILLRMHNRYPLRLLLTLLMLSALLYAVAAQAQRVHRCIDAEGRPLFSDQPCDSQNARRPEDPAPLSATEALDLSTKQAEKDARMGYCPAWDFESLQAELEASFRASDVNRMAALYHWPGATRRSSTAVLDEMERLLRRPLNDLAQEEPDLPYDWQLGDPEPLPLLRLELGGSDALETPEYARFGVLRHAGCLWITSIYSDEDSY